MITLSIPRAKLERRKRDSAAVDQAWLGFCTQEGFHSMSSAWISKSHFSTWRLCLLNYIYASTMRSWPPPKCCNFFKRRVILHKKRRVEPSLWKTFCVSFFSRNEEQPAFKFDKDLNVLRIYCMIPRTPGFLGWVHFFGMYHSNRSLF
jgi:hypothetical protein